MTTRISIFVVVFIVALPAAAVVWTAPVVGAEGTDDSYGEFVYPLVTRRPFLDREFEFRVNHEKGPAGPVTELRGSLEIPILPTWRGGLGNSLVFTHPRDPPSLGGGRELTLQNQVFLFK